MIVRKRDDVFVKRDDGLRSRKIETKILLESERVPGKFIFNSVKGGILI